MNRKSLLAILAIPSLTLGLAACGDTSDEVSGDTENFPTKPVNLVVPYDAGGNLDTIVRGVTQCMEGELGQRVIIDNQSGSAGTLGTGKVAAADPDGYTLGVSPIGPIAVTPNSVGNVNYDATDFEYYGYVSNPPMLIAVPGDSEFNTLEEVVEAGKTRSIVTVTPGASSLQAMFVNGLNESEDSELTLVQTDSAIEILRGLSNNDYEIGVTTASAEILPRLESGEIKLIAHGGAPGFEAFPDVESFEEAGYGDVIPVTMLPSALIGPAGIPAETGERISEVLETCISNDEVKQRVGELIIAPEFVDGEEVKEDFVAIHELTSSQN